MTALGETLEQASWVELEQRLRRLVHARVGDHSDADDVLQDVLLRI